MEATRPAIVLVLQDIRSAQNVGALFRTADAIGVQKIYLSAITPSPLDRFGRPRSDIAKTALGAEQTLLYEEYSDSGELVSYLKKEGYAIVSLEQSSQSIDYKTYRPTEKTALIIGNEVSGLPEHILTQSDVVIEIPMRGEKESLNVTTATGIVLFRLFDR